MGYRVAQRKATDPRSDAALIAICNGGGPAAAGAFDALYRRHKDYVLRVALRFVPDTDTALDVLQETFLYLLRQFPPVGEGLTLRAKLTTLLYPVAKNNAISALRRAGRFPQAEQAPDDLAAPPAADDGDLRRVLDGLPPGQREVLLLRFVDDLPLGDIAEVLDIPLGTVKSRLHLGIRSLRASPAAQFLLGE